jgi:triacylglycerol esterase/lipase EstA (alpha/beta hydrolase family)
MLAVVAVVVAVAAFVGVRSAGDPPADGPVKVLLVPGYGGARAALSTLADRLRAGGRSAEVLTLPGDGTGDLRAQTRVLSEAAGDGMVDVIGYSAGGVVARLWVAGDGARQTRRVITLGSPMHGTDIAAAGGALAPGACPVACQQLSPGSAVLRDVGAAPGGVPWMSVWTADDETVVPPESARMAGAVNVPLQGICPDAVVSHSELPTDPLVTGLVLRTLAAATVTAPAARDCSALRAAGD